MMATPYRVTVQFWDHATLWSDDDSDAGHSTDGGRVFGVTRTRYDECDSYGCGAVVVIDPENAEAVERLVKLATGLASPFAVRVEELQAALREFANPKPPKPEEPTGLGAVVRDAQGMTWVRCNTRTGTAEWRSTDFTPGFVHFDTINAVEVLSEGVTP